MKKNFKIAAILMIIAAICGLAVSAMNMVTAPIIEKNQLKKEAELCQEIFAEFDIDHSKIITEELSNEAISKKIEAKNSEAVLLGYIYTVSGRNSYGPISLLVGIDAEGKLVSIEFLENGQSYASTVQEHVDSNYKEGLTSADVSGIDTKCGATYGANTVKELVTIVFNDFNNGGAQ